MQGPARLLLAIVASCGCATAAGLVRFRSRGRAGGLASWGFLPALLGCLLIIPRENVGLRAAAAFASGDLAFKMVDFFRHRGRSGPGSPLRAYYHFLIPFPVFSVAYPDHKRRLTRPDRPWPHVLRIAGGTIVVASALLLLGVKRGSPRFRSSFVLDHVAVLAMFVVTIESISQALYGLERLAGYDVAPIIRGAYLSRSVSEFWQRYNGRVHDWLYRNVFRPSGGRRRPVRGVALVFLVSGLFHEVMFDLATSKITGYQLAFFLLQAPPALASRWFERLARRPGIAGKLAAHGLTILFLAASSILFFRGVSDIFPFIYASRSPLP
jgi:hypothetical protein